MDRTGQNGYSVPGPAWNGPTELKTRSNSFGTVFMVSSYADRPKRSQQTITETIIFENPRERRQRGVIYPVLEVPIHFRKLFCLWKGPSGTFPAIWSES